MFPGYLNRVKSVFRVLVVFGVLALPLLFFPGVLVRGEVVSANDHLSVHAVFQEEPGGEVTHPSLSDPAVQFSSLRARVVSALKQGRVPLWNPDIYAGAPLLADAQSRPFSPVTGAHLVFSEAIAQNVGVWWLLLWPALGSYLLLCRLGLDRSSAACGAAACLGLPYLHVWLLHPHASTYVWLPWMILGVEVIGARGSPVPLVLGALGVMTGGHPETAAHVLLLTAGWSIWRCRRLEVVGALVLGGVVSAAAWVPVLENISHSATLDAHGGNRLALSQMMDLMWPNIQGHPADGGFEGRGVWADGVLHPGLGAMILAILALRRRLGRVFWKIFGLCVLLSLIGGPLLNNARLASIAVWFLALACGVGATALSPRLQWLACGGILLGGMHARQHDQHTLSVEQHLAEPADWANELSEKLNQQSRIVGFGASIEPNTASHAHLRDLRGYDLPVSRHWERFFRNLDPRMIRPNFPIRGVERRNEGVLTFAGVGAFLSSEPLEDLQPIELKSKAPVWIYEPETPGVRAWIAEGATMASDQEAALRQISLDPLARERPAVEGIERGWPGKTFSPVPVIEITPEHLELEVSTSTQRLLVLADAWSPGWRVVVDEEERPLLRVGGYFRGVLIGPGDTRVAFVYRPMGWVVGSRLSTFGLVLLVLLAGARFRRHRLASPPHA